MQIYMVLSVLAPQGGIEAALVPLAKELQAAGHAVRVYVLQPPPQPNQNLTALLRAGIRVRVAPPATVQLAGWLKEHQAGVLKMVGVLALPVALPLAVVDAVRRRRSVGRSLAGVLGRLRAAVAPRLNLESRTYSALASWWRSAPPDVVHVHGWGCGEDPPGALAWLAGRRCAVVYTEHNSPDPRLHQPISAAPMNAAGVLVAVSQAGRAGLEQVGGATKPIHVIPYSVEALALPDAPPPPEAFTITCVARLAQQKGQAILLDALSGLRATVPQARLLLAGAGPLEGALREQTRRLGLEQHVEFLGLVARSDLPALLARTDVIALPSYWEGLPVALIEALSAGKPIVASAVGGNPELVHDRENGLIVPPGDAHALAAALAQLASDPDLRRRMGTAARARFDTGEFSHARVAQLHLAAYQHASEHLDHHPHP